jgi:hypothetical protein
MIAKQVENQNKKTQHYLIPALIVVLVAGMGAGLYFYMSQPKNKPLAVEEKTMAVEEKKEAAVVNNNKADLDSDRAKLEEFLQQYGGGQFDPETQPPSPGFQTIEVIPGAKYKLQVDYASIGDMKMENASLFVRIGQGLKVNPKSMNDNFMGNSQPIDESMYSESEGAINYGPGTGNKKESSLEVADRGYVTFELEVSKDLKPGDVTRVYSYVNNSGGNKGKIDLVFFKVK